MAEARRIVIDRPGAYDRLRVQSFEPGDPGPGEVRVDVRAIGVNYADCVIRMGLYASARKYVGYPITPGFEFSGVVDRAGAGVGDLLPGDPVFGVTRFGAYATSVTVPRHQVFRRPSCLTETEAAAFPTVALTAWYALVELGAPRPGQRHLVHSAAGGVGSMLVQLGRIEGAEVTAVVGAPHKVEVARGLGADHVIDKSSDDLWPRAEAIAPSGFDRVFDANGVATLRRSYEHLAPEGRLIVYGFHSMLPRGGGRPNRLKLAYDYLRTPRFDPLRLTGENRSVMGFNLSYLFDRGDRLAACMPELLAHVERGALRVARVTTYAFEDVAAAHRDLESGRTVGKLVLLP